MTLLVGLVSFTVGMVLIALTAEDIRDSWFLLAIGGAALIGAWKPRR